MLPFAEIIPSAVAPMVHDWSHLINFGFRLGVDAIALIVLVRVLYYPRHHNKDFVFSFTLFNVINFLICHLLSNNNLQVGFLQINQLNRLGGCSVNLPLNNFSNKLKPDVLDS